MCENDFYLAILEQETCDLRCVDLPAFGANDYDFEWVVIQHHMAEPQEREIGRGKTAIEAIKDAFDLEA